MSNIKGSIKKQFPDILKKAKGFVQLACQVAGIHRTTYYRWLEDPKFAKACDEAMEHACAFIESKWLENIEKGSQGAIDKWLKYKGKVFGYIDEVIVEDTQRTPQLSEADFQILKAYEAKYNK